jgi:hypothetical protein
MGENQRVILTLNTFLKPAFKPHFWWLKVTPSLSRILKFTRSKIPRKLTFFLLNLFHTYSFKNILSSQTGCTYFSKSNDNPRFLVTFLLNCCHTNPLKTRFKKVLRCFRHRIGRHRRGTSRWVPGNQSFTSSIFTTPRFPYVDLTLTHPRHFYDSRVSWGVPRLQTRSWFTGDPRWLLPKTSLHEWDQECVVGVEPMC